MFTECRIENAACAIITLIEPARVSTITSQRLEVAEERAKPRPGHSISNLLEGLHMGSSLGRTNATSDLLRNIILSFSDSGCM
jgi:hypothetical protein